jgi:phosphoserine phosphatase RsbU/P
MTSLDLSRCRVLVVDDNAFNRKTLAMLVKRTGVGEVEFAGDGEEGLCKVERFLPDLVLLDVEMPRMDGLEMCRRLREIPQFAELPVLFQTILDSEDEQVRCFAAGGNDYITKPIRAGECVARVRQQLEKRLAFKDLSSFRRRLDGELRHARDMQLSLLPENRQIAAAEARYGMSIRAHFETSSELGGDFWHIYPLDDRRLAVLIVDFAGHGITAAINTFRLHTLIDRLPADRGDPAEWLGALGAALKGVLPVGQFATAFYAVIDIGDDSMVYAGAGAPPPVMIVGDGDAFSLNSAGLVLGVSRTGFHQNRRVAFPPGARLFLYSDALSESADHAGQVLGLDGVPPLAAQAVRSNPADPPAALLKQFFANHARPLRDDLTAVWIERR